MDEARLIEKLLAIQALHAGATTPGEREAAQRASERILERLQALQAESPAVEYRFSMSDMWERKVFVALCRRYGLRPYRYKRQRYTTVMVMVPKRFVDETLWPEFLQLSETLEAYLASVTERVVAQVIHADTSDAEVTDEPRQLTLSPPGAHPCGAASPRAGGAPRGGPASRSPRKEGRARQARWSEGATPMSAGPPSPARSSRGRERRSPAGGA